MGLIKICLLGIVGTLMMILLKNYKAEYGIVLGVVLSVVIMSFIVDYLGKILEQVSLFQNYLGDYQGFLSIMLKAVGCTYACEFASGVCRDAGNSSVATQIEVLGKIWLMFMGIPVITSLLQTIEKLY